MRRFACTNFQITTELDSKLSYIPCYMQCGFIVEMFIREMNLFVLQYYFKDNAINLKEGHHRLKIANELGINKIPVKIIVVWNQNIKRGETIYNPPTKLDIEGYIKRNYYPTFIEPSELGLF